MIKLLGSFLKEKRGDICLYIGFIGVFYVIFSLSNLPVDAVNYAFFLSAIWLLGYGIFKFNQYYKKGVAVIEAKQRLEEVTENLPATRSYIELEYQAIIQNMYIDGAYHHPTFLYESVGNIIAFLLIIFVIRKFQKHIGMQFFGYFVFYGVVRFFVEGLRTDSLMFGPIRMAQLISIVFFAVGIVGMVYVHMKGTKVEEFQVE